jgi:hypothetical protein
LIEAEATARIGAEPYQRTETRTTSATGIGIGCSVRKVIGVAQPATRREAMSMTVARYSQPSQVGT